VAVDHCPEAIGLGVVGRTLVHHHAPAEGVIPDQRPRSHHPADIRHPEEVVVGFLIEAEVDLLRTLHQDPGVGVDDPLRFAGRARGVEQHRLLGGVEFLGFVLARLLAHRSVPALVARVVPRNLASVFTHTSALARRQPKPIVDDGVFDVAGLCDRLVGTPFQPYLVATAVEPVTREQDCGFSVPDSGGGRIHTEAREDRHGDRADLETPVEDGDHFGDHRHVEPDGVARFDAARFEAVRHPV
jgi:hypothetical protein